MNKYLELIDPVDGLKVWLRSDLIDYAYEEDKDTVMVHSCGETHRVSKESWDNALSIMQHGRRLVEDHVCKCEI